MEVWIIDEVVVKCLGLVVVIYLIFGVLFVLYGWINNLLVGYLFKFVFEKFGFYIGYMVLV